MVDLDKSPEPEGCVDQKAMEGEKNESTRKSEEPEKPEEKSDNQGEKDGKNKQCKHKRERESGERGKPQTDALDKDEIHSKEREKLEYFWDTMVTVFHNKLEVGLIGVKLQEPSRLQSIACDCLS